MAWSFVAGVVGGAFLSRKPKAPAPVHVPSPTDRYAEAEERIQKRKKRQKSNIVAGVVTRTTKPVTAGNKVRQ